jgi:hypothetical protein
MSLAALDGAYARADHAAMVEFATLTAIVSLFTTSLGTLQQRVADRVASSNAAAVQQAVARARAIGAPPAGAKVAFESAPYRAPALRYLYSIGWSVGVKHRSLCVLGRIDAEGTVDEIVGALRKSQAAVKEIRKLHLTVVEAGRSFARGFLSSCA